MARKVAESCRNCGAELAPGSSFCTLCGTAVTNRAASPAPNSVPLGGPSRGNSSQGGSSQGAVSFGGPPHAPQQLRSVPGIVPLGTQPAGPLVEPVQVGENAQLAAATVLERGGAGRRLVAKLVDGVLPAVLMIAALAVGTALMSVKTSGGYQTIDFTWLAVLGGIASLASLAYGLWLWFWEARTGKTPGNLILGLRTTNMDGHPAGVLAIFLRNLIVALGSVAFYIGTVVVIISNAWDANGKRQGWHDKVAHTLVFNVKTGRNPLETGGIAGREAYTPAEMAGIAPVNSPVPGAAPWHGSGRGAEQGYRSDQGAAAQTFVPGRSTEDQGGSRQNGIQHGGPALAGPSDESPYQASPFAPPAAPAAAGPAGAPDSGPITGVPFSRPAPPENSPQPPGQHASAEHTPAQSAPNQYAPAQYAPAQYAPAQGASAQNLAQGTGPDGFAPSAAQAPAGDDLGETRVRPAAGNPALRLAFDDGSTEEVRSVALIGRNPAGYDGEMIEHLVSVRDSSRSVSKTHLHVRASGEGLWVTDRNSTNGSAITNPTGQKSPLHGGTPVLAEVGATVHFGDRSFQVGQA